jgi:hypothetical protein
MANVKPVKINLKDARDSAKRLSKALNRMSQMDVMYSGNQMMRALTKSVVENTRNTLGREYILRNRYFARQHQGSNTTKYGKSTKVGPYFKSWVAIFGNTPWAKQHEMGGTLKGGKGRQESGKDHALPTVNARVGGSQDKRVAKRFKNYGDVVNQGNMTYMQGLTKAHKEGKFFVPKKRYASGKAIIHILRGPRKGMSANQRRKNLKNRRMFTTKILYFYDKVRHQPKRGHYKKNIDNSFNQQNINKEFLKLFNPAISKTLSKAFTGKYS